METCVTLLIYFIKMYYKQGQYIYKLFIYRNVPHITNLLYKYVLQTGNIYIYIFIYVYIHKLLIYGDVRHTTNLFYKNVLQTGTPDPAL